MAGKTVTVGCKLPHGIVLEHPTNPTVKVALKGKHAATIIGAEHSNTEVDVEFWQDWSKANANFPAFKSGAIFVGKSSVDVDAMAKDLKGLNTGFEAMRTDGKDERAGGVKTATVD